MKETPETSWNLSALELLATLETDPQGLSREEACRRLELNRVNRLKTSHRSTLLSLFLAQFKSPIILILIAAAILSSALHDAADALIILAIVFMSGLLGLWQERGAWIERFFSSMSGQRRGSRTTFTAEGIQGVEESLRE
jgi:Mg2+-importing ATPase